MRILQELAAYEAGGLANQSLAVEWWAGRWSAAFQDERGGKCQVVGNKSDVPEERRQVKKEDVNEWVFCELPKIRAKILECSAKENLNIREIFKSFLQLAKIALPTESNALRRRSSTHVTIGRPPRFNSSLSPAREQQAESSPETTQQQSTSQKSTKPRSRSLIRRTSKKSSKLKDAAATPGCSADGDCHIS
ncbi:hypothetical protein AVEN_49134-1 [Araneus ventricosus]|uniref:Uncharacterized protein n=1 Tax=Araneus ventricosus TaxID=182803 RepID=A0A4Y2BZP1_ARAVE|nr:hypothetical protein AVEN_49134-1 [Araneus ventricosus]